MRRLATLRLVIASALLVSACQQPPANLNEQEVASVEQVIEDVTKTLLAADFAGWAGLFSEDAVIYSPNSPSVSGRAVIQEWGEAFPPIEGLSFFNVQVWGQGDLAYATSNYAFKVEGSPADTGKQLWVFRRASSEDWEVAAASYSSDLPPAVPAE